MLWRRVTSKKGRKNRTQALTVRAKNIRIILEATSFQLAQNSPRLLVDPTYAVCYRSHAWSSRILKTVSSNSFFFSSKTLKFASYVYQQTSSRWTKYVFHKNNDMHIISLPSTQCDLESGGFEISKLLTNEGGSLANEVYVVFGVSWSL